MTARQLLLMNCVYLALLVAAAYFTRATRRRFAGALAGGATVGLATPGLTALAQEVGWWSVPLPGTPYSRLLLYVGLALSYVPIALIGWRVARRFGRQGLTVLFGITAVVGPLRDYRVAAQFPEWIVFAPGVMPLLANAAAYVGTMALALAVMRLVAGPASDDPVARRPRAAA